MQFSEPSKDFIRPIELQALSEIQNEQGPVFSLYLDLRRERRVAGNPLERFQNLLRQAEQQRKLDQDPPEYRQQWEQETNRIRRWLETDPLRGGLGLALFSSEAAGLWRTFLLPVPVMDRLVVRDQPYVRPLELLLGEFKCTLVALIDAGAARLVEVSLGQAEEVDRVESVPVTGTLQGEDNPHVSAVIERMEEAWQDLGCDRLVIGGSDETLDDLRDTLPEPLRERLVGEVRLSPLAPMEDLLDEMIEIDTEREQQIEAQRVEELVSRVENTEPAVLGLEKTLLVVRSGKVRLLVTEEDYHREGGECPNCGFLAEAEEKQCLLCGMALRPEPDIIEVALKRVLDAGGEIEVLRSQRTRSALASHGHIGALLYESGRPHEKDASGRATLARDGKINPDALHDEAIQESFPGSDPPSWTHGVS